MIFFFFIQCGYCDNSLQHDVDQIRQINRVTDINRLNSANREQSRIPLVLTYHPLNRRIKRILLSNFTFLSGNPETREIFPQAPMVAYRHDQNLRDIHVYTPVIRANPVLSWVLLCVHTLAVTLVVKFPPTPPCRVLNAPLSSRRRSPAKHLTWCIAFAVICCHRCPALYIGETGHTLGQRFGEHLHSIEKNLSVFQSQSISMLTAILCRAQKSVALYSA